MTKKIIFGIIAFIIGFGIALYSESFFREIIQDVFKWSTSDKIKFVANNMYIFSDKTYYITLGIVPLILTLENLNKKMTTFLKNGIICLLIFGISLVTISVIDANIKIAECTACDDGIRKLHWNGINYGLIIGASAIISIVPSLIRIIKRTKKASVQQRV
ncbi:hypothetical protein SAMN04488007_0294 [Maribacter aquivivus]|uniref:Uncharacterized protein n=1 Tax=Maribacter aquivivus TaxID=228958 RepID=A0A1M6J795_9FLAO|nr:hypothetical protein [Maribacter aquivivus]SHJ42556.1 hypothetical protein SAMN04488007_0294 [Maribacter aquivivus]